MNQFYASSNLAVRPKRPMLNRIYFSIYLRYVLLRIKFFFVRCRKFHQKRWETIAWYDATHTKLCCGRCGAEYLFDRDTQIVSPFLRLDIKEQYEGKEMDI